VNGAGEVGEPVVVRSGVIRRYLIVGSLKEKINTALSLLWDTPARLTYLITVTERHRASEGLIRHVGSGGGVIVLLHRV
jgi:hypothetical protein